MHNAVIAAVFMSFLLVPAILADTALREKFQGMRNLGRPLAEIAMDAWVPKFQWNRKARQPVQWIESTESEERAELKQLAYARSGESNAAEQMFSQRSAEGSSEVVLVEPTFAKPTYAAPAIQQRRFARRRRPVHLMEVAAALEAAPLAATAQRVEVSGLMQSTQLMQEPQPSPLAHVTRLTIPRPPGQAVPALPTLLSQLAPQSQASQWTWTPAPRPMADENQSNRNVPFRQLGPALGRLLLFSFEVPGVILRLAREHYRQPSARRMKQPEMLTVRGVAPPW